MLGMSFYDVIFCNSIMSCLQKLEVTVWREGMEYQQKYSRGKPITTLACHVLPVDSEDCQGTRIRFWPDKEGFLDSFINYILSLNDLGVTYTFGDQHFSLLLALNFFYSFQRCYSI